MPHAPTARVALTQAGAAAAEDARPRTRNHLRRARFPTGAAREACRHDPRNNIRACGADPVLWPVLNRPPSDYPDIHVQLLHYFSLTDIVANGSTLAFDWGRIDCQRHGRRAHRSRSFVWPWSGRRPILRSSRDRAAPRTSPGIHCINLSAAQTGGLYAGSFTKKGRESKVLLDGQSVFNSVPMIVRAAMEWLWPGLRLGRSGSSLHREGRWCASSKTGAHPFSGYHLYYPSRRQPSAAFTLLVEALRYRPAA